MPSPTPTRVFYTWPGSWLYDPAQRPGSTLGKRKRYFNPFTFLLLVLGFTIFVNSIFHPYSREVAQTQTRFG
ncbi:MAG: DUF3667 domain-containing protein [Cytophagaceae bacterium]|nr:DUF3667 domain-containing protein [Cytophagaceae bacterium]